ncbi:MAG: hypothetical protein PHF74_01030 [Dehalococcoidales bacterium]|nr:hypothetical protein [Dehalococcoidales bacterium]
MIKNKQDYLNYLEEDRIALRRKKQNLHGKLKDFILPDCAWRFEKILRTTEYHLNCNHKLRYLLYYYRLLRLCDKMAIYILPNCFGPGLNIIHLNGIFVWGKARIGKNCRIYHEVTIGSTPSTQLGPRLGDNILIGAGAKILGDIEIADNIAIGANSVVIDSFTEKGITIAGIPAKKVSNNGSADYINEMSSWLKRNS